MSPKYSTGTRSRRTCWIATDIRANVGRNAALRSRGTVSQQGWSVGGFICYVARILPGVYSREGRFLLRIHATPALISPAKLHERLEIETRQRFLVCFVTGGPLEPLPHIFCVLALQPRIVCAAKNVDRLHPSNITSGM